ncbi:hypothetical protein [Leifsonia sp. Root112D2]|uniref:hypothetical protein n=1 Tax=Leifsonia sp. Root112D2 TaxID=1736426 RepID=UPI0012F8C27B|nr:hypothetical protein [Leifsonia sp. Root112D2]
MSFTVPRCTGIVYESDAARRGGSDARSRRDSGDRSGIRLPTLTLEMGRSSARLRTIE